MTAIRGLKGNMHMQSPSLCILDFNLAHVISEIRFGYSLFEYNFSTNNA